MANQGLYHPTYNPNGSKKASDNNFWYNTTVSFNSLADCFDPSKLLSTSGNIGTVSGRPDGLFYDQVHESGVLDLRNSSAKVEDYNRLIDREFNKLVTGTYRGSEGELVNVLNGTFTAVASSSSAFYFTTTRPIWWNTSASTTAVYDDNMEAHVIFSGNGYRTKTRLYASDRGYGVVIGVPVTVGQTATIVVSIKSTRTKSNNLTHTDIIGSPANYPTAWKQSGVSGTPLIVAEDGTSMLPTGVLTVFKLSRKANAAPLQVLKSTDSGVAWTALTVTTHYTFSTVTNAITMVTAPATTDLIMVTYQTHTNMAVAGVNSKVLEVGDVVANNVYFLDRGGLLSQLINKVSIGSASPYNNQTPIFKTINYDKTLDTTSGAQTHNNVILTNTTSPTVKAFPYLTQVNGKARLQLVFKEMKYSSANADWGDDSTFNIVDNVSTTTDWYGSTILIGQKYAELPYFIEAKE